MNNDVQKVRNQLNLIMDCFEYCCDRIDNYEDKDAANETINHDILIPALKDSLLNALTFALWGDLHTVGCHSNKRRTDYASIKKETSTKHSLRTEKEDWRSILDHLMFNTQEEAITFSDSIEDYAETYGRVTVGYIFEILDECSSLETEYYGWASKMILNQIKIVKTDDMEKIQVILPPPVRLE